MASVWLRPSTVVIDTPEWFEIRNGASPLPLHNAVRRCRVRGPRLRERVEEVVAYHRAAGSAVNWTVSPLDTPGLGEVLVAAGFRATHTMWGMVRGTSPLEGVPGDVEVRPADDAEHYARVSERGWEMRAEFFSVFVEDVRLGLTRGLRAWVAAVDGQDVGSGKVLDPHGYLMGGAVDPAFRGRGVYRALVDARLAVLRDEGLDTACIVALSTTSAPTCQRMGFRRVGDFQMFVWKP